ncbi:hypothetical protein Tco_0549215 [Tanacetum coccineum]
MSYLVRAYYSISLTRYYKDDSCWSADLKLNTTEDIISIGSFMEVLGLNHYVLVRKLFYAFNDSLLLTPLCCDDIHDVTPRVSALAGCDRLVFEPLVIENTLVMFFPTRKKSRWGTVFPTGLKRYKEPLVEPKEIG